MQATLTFNRALGEMREVREKLFPKPSLISLMKSHGGKYIRVTESAGVWNHEDLDVILTSTTY